MQQMIELDRLDRKILCELERDAHLTNIKLAERVGLCHPRPVYDACKSSKELV